MISSVAPIVGRPILGLVAALSLGSGRHASAEPAADVSPAQPVIPDRTFSLADYGGVPDGKTPNTDAFHRAVGAVEKAGGGTLNVPPGVWFTGPFDLASRINLHLEAGARILFTSSPSAYKQADGKFRPLLLTTDAHDVMISGRGTLDGNGQAWWPGALVFKKQANRMKARSNTSPRPRLVIFDHCDRVRVEGVTLTRSPVFNLVPLRCNDVTVEGITILNPEDSPNTDGIDPSLSHRVLIERCRIDTGDDCIALKSGGPAGEGVSDVLVTDCAFFHGHGCSIGSETSGTVRNVLVRRCTFDHTDIGVRLKSDRTRGGLLDNVTYTDLTMTHVGMAIVIVSFYPDRDIPAPGVHVDAKPVTRTTPMWHHVTLRNITATKCERSAGLILGLPEAPVEALVLDNVAIAAPYGLRIGYTRGIELRQVRIKAAHGPGLEIDDSVEDVDRTD